MTGLLGWPVAYYLVAASIAAEGCAAARLSQQLVRIETALDMPPVREPLDQLWLQLPADRGQALLRQFEELGFVKHSSRVRDLWASQLYSGR